MIEAVLLTGGRSSRMGCDKSTLLWQGRPLAEVIASRLLDVVERVTVLGRTPIAGCHFLQDRDAFEGPLAALSHFSPEAGAVFVSACDVPAFDEKLLTLLSDRLERHPSVHAVLPDIGHSLQPLAALYRAEAFTLIPTLTAEGRRSMMSWVDTLWVETVDSEELTKHGLDPACVQSVDTPEMLASLIAQVSTRTV